ncbi:electron transfer flavoprotein subunit beta/FixA family protein [Desulfobacterales bacterium HSG17]|nr:electron transfer flavoprotein subunit beta/FixA family protein [Desulfobacterales bacterium HSG17]
MKIFVCVKHVPDTAASIKVDGQAGYNSEDIVFIINPYDEYAIEEAVSIVEKEGGEVVIITLGKPDAVTSIRTALAMGADRAILIKTDEQFPDSSMTARVIAAAIEQDGLPDIIFCGKGSVDSESFQTQYRLAENLVMPVINDVSTLTLDTGKITAQRDIGSSGKQVIEMKLPGVIGAAKGLNEPRYPTVMNVMKAKKKKINEIEISDLGIDPKQNRVIMEKLESAPERANAEIIQGSVDNQVTELIRILREDKKVI